MKLKTILSTALCSAMLLASSSLFAQVKIGTNPTAIEANSNLEVEASTAGRKVKVDKATGQVTIADGTQGTGKILTSDANGGASWQTTANQRIPETVFISEQTPGQYVITTWNNVFNDVKDRIPMVPRSGSLPGYNATTKQYTIQESGYYRIHTGAALKGTQPGAQVTAANLYLVPDYVLGEFRNLNNGTGPVLSVYWERFYTAGETVNLMVRSLPNGGPDQNILVEKGFISITKLF